MADENNALEPASDMELSDFDIVQQVNTYRNESQEAKKGRMRLNRQNRAAYNNEQNWDHKIEGQSTEFVPKTSGTVEQFAAFLKRALTQFGDWFSVDVPEDYPLSRESVQKILSLYLDKLPDGANWTSLTERMTDGSKVALLESVMVFKIHGFKKEEDFFRVSKNRMGRTNLKPWRLSIELVKNEDYDVDPTGRGLYEIHRVERDLHEVVEMAKAGVYRKEIVDQIKEDFEDKETKNERKQPGVDENKVNSFRKKVVIDEFWGTLLTKTGEIAKKRVLCAVANEKYLIRPPEKFPWWHGMSSFVRIPLLRLPFSTWHRALYDQVVPLNLAMNELFNLMVDGGLASVWGVRQVKPSLLEDPRQISDGVPQGKTLVVNETAAPGEKVMEQVSTGQIPPDAMAMYNLLDREFNQGAMTNDIKQGMLPPRQVKATEVVEASNNSAVQLDAIATDVEKHMSRMLQMAWLLVLQNADDLMVNDLEEILTPRELLALSEMSPRERFTEMANNITFKVFGLSATLQRARDFQKLMALLQVVGQNPVLTPAFMRNTSPDKLLKHLYKMVNINPRDFERDQDDQTQQGDQEFLLQQLQGQQGSVNIPGEAGQQSDINQETNPTAGV